MSEVRQDFITPSYEVVETCPHCDCDNVFANYDADKDGYEVTCWNCGRKIMLCSLCYWADDNREHKCDWSQHGKVTKCFRMKQKRSANDT